MKGKGGKSSGFGAGGRQSGEPIAGGAAPGSMHGGSNALPGGADGHIKHGHDKTPDMKYPADHGMHGTGDGHTKVHHHPHHGKK